MMSTTLKKLKNLEIIVNPAAGKMEPILPVLNEVLTPAGIDWDVSITKQAGDALVFAKDAVKRKVDVIGVYGGDGTLMEVISGAIGSEIPLAIFPGGTANVLATELGIPKNLRESCKMVCEGQVAVRAVDVGQFDKRYFILRTSLGFEAEMVKNADRKVKNKFGLLAYGLGALTALQKLQDTVYDVTIDGTKHHIKGVTCIVCNSASLGVANLTLDKDVSVSDGLLDIIVQRKANINVFGQFIGTLFKRELPHDVEVVEHWQGRDIKVTSKPKQFVQCDGEVLKTTAIHAKIIPSAVNIFVPVKPVEEILNS